MRSVSLRHRFAVLLALLTAASAHAQPPAASDFAIQHLTLRDGLPEVSAFAVLQDPQGFLWFYTQNGLVRYDGHTMRAFRPDAQAPGSLCAPNASMMHQDRRGLLWLATQGALMRFDPATERTTCFLADPDNPAAPSSSTIADIVPDRHDHLWVTYQPVSNPSHGVVLAWRPFLDRIDLRTGRLTRVRHDPRNPHSLASDTLSGRGLPVHVLASGAVWIALHGGGLDRYEAATGRFVHLRPDPNNPHALSPGTAGFLYESPRQPGVLWMSVEDARTRTAVLNRLDTRTGRVTRYAHDASDPNRLGLTRPTAVYEDRRGRVWVLGNGLGHLDVRTGRFTRVLEALSPTPVGPLLYERVYEDRSGRLWLVNGQGQLSVFDPASGRLSSVLDTDHSVKAWHEDRAGNIWVGTWGNAVFRIAPSAPRFRTISLGPDAPERSGAGFVRAVEAGDDGRLWLTLDNRLARFDPATGRVERFPLETSALLRDAGGRLWAAGQGELLQIDAQGRVRQRLPLPDQTRAMKMVEGAPGELWVATYGEGLYGVDTATGRVRHRVNSPTDTTSLSDNYLMALAWDARDRTLWIGTNNVGVNHFDPRTGRVRRFGTSVQSPLSSTQGLHIDRKGQLWAVSYFDGLHLLDRRTGRTRRYSLAEGLPDPTSEVLLEDGQGAIWVGTANGIARLDQDRGTFRAFGAADGVMAGRNYNNAVLLMPDGQAYFGGRNGLTTFRPDALAPSQASMPVVVTGLRVRDRLLTPGPDSALTTSITTARRLALPHTDNDLTFEFAALAFDRNPSVRYRYQLEGYDTGWSAPTADRAARYTNLSPGRYTFRVKAANADGVWSASQARLVVVIRPPWWRTWWAYALYSLLVLLALAWLVRAVRHRARVRERERVRAERERARERELAQAKEIEAAYTQLKGTQAQLVQQQAQLVKQEKLASLGALTAGIAHEIKNPLNFVNNFAQLSEELVAELETERAQNPDARLADVDDVLSDLRSNAARIREHGQRADSIVKNMLAHSRGTTGTREVVDMNALVDEYTSLAFHGVRAQRPDFTCTIERRLDAAPSMVEAVPQDVSRVLLNVVGNAFYAVGKRREAEGAAYEPTVRVSTRSEGGDVVTEVWDNGGGIPEAVRAKIFEPFFTTKPTGEGTGLGLSLSHDIIAAHGGTLLLDTEAGAWTCFTIRLPAVLPTLHA